MGEEEDKQSVNAKTNRVAVVFGLAMVTCALAYLAYAHGMEAWYAMTSQPEVLAVVILMMGLLVIIVSSKVGREIAEDIASGSSLSRGFVSALVGITAGTFEAKLSSPPADKDQNEDVQKTSQSAAALSPSAEAEVVAMYRRALDHHFGPKVSTELKVLVNEQFKREAEFLAERFMIGVNVRLSNASSTVTVRGFVNLLLGIAFAGGAVYVLYQAIAVFTPESLSTLPLSSVLYLTGTRISLALVITLVAYFFLSLYRKSLEDVKFYQNEMTNISSRAAALQLAYFEGDKDLKRQVAFHLVESDRNRTEPIESSDQSEGLASEIVKKLIDKLPEFKIGGSSGS